MQVFDARGRIALQQRSKSSGAGRDLIDIDLTTGPTSGLYFLRVADSSGRISPAVKFVFVR
jgi:hypothetical protein